MTNNVIEWAESCIGRKLTDAEKEIVRIDCEISERLNVGSVKALKKYGIEIGGMSMTENEATEIIKKVPLFRYECELEKGRQSDLFKALYMAIQALEEIEQYRAIGTVEELEAMKKGTLSAMELADIWCVLEDLKRYSAIGTIEEFKALKEKEERFDRNIKMFNEIGLEIRAKAIDEFAERITKRLKEEVALLENERNEAREYEDEQIIFATNNQLRAFDYSLRVIEEEMRGAE